MRQTIAMMLLAAGTAWAEDPPTPGGYGGQGFPKPYSPPCTERENIFEFTEKPAVKMVGQDKYEITFAVKGNCDVTVGIVDSEGKVVRHLGSGVLGANAPAPFQKNSLKQTIYWHGKDDLDVYHKTPEKLKVRVMLGLKPEFDKRLGGTSAKNLPGYICGLACGPDGGYVIAKGAGPKGHATVRHFDRDGNYVNALSPPAANLPEDKLKGLGYVEYEPGKRAVQGPNAYQTTADRGNYLTALGGGRIGDEQPVLVGDRLYWGSAGYGEDCAHLQYVYTDGSTDVQGMKGLPLVASYQRHPRFAASPDGKWIYMSGVGSAGQDGGDASAPAILRRSSNGNAMAEPFIGKWTERKKGQFDYQPGSDNQSLNNPRGLDCDAQGRIYVADSSNARIQIFSPEGKHLKTIPVDRPKLVRVHQKTGGVYVVHSARVEGKSLDRVTKFGGFDNPAEEFHVDNLGAASFALDSWSPKPRLWLAGSRTWVDTSGAYGDGPGLRIFEEDGKALRKMSDFEEEAKKEAGASWFGKWSGMGCMGSAVVCDPTREKVYFEKSVIFDLKTGANLGGFGINMESDDIAFDKRGYMHAHFNPGFAVPGVGRVDPGRGGPGLAMGGTHPNRYPEVPYDYGVDTPHRGGWLGILPVKDQPGAKFFQDGIGVNMRGDVAENCNIYYVPKMEDSVMGIMNAGADARRGSGAADAVGFQCTGGISYQDFMRKIQDMQKRGEEVYFIKRRPGISLSGGTIWTFDSSGELRDECAVIAGMLIEGPLIDENGKLHFINSRICMRGGRPFLSGQGGTFGAPDDKSNVNPFTGTFMKTAGKDVRVLLKSASVPLEPPPSRPADLAGGYGEDAAAWVEGAEWLYAGASPVVAGGCSCPVPRAYLDWYKRSFVPEAYRHSFGVLDTAGNLIMHLGRYGNFDSGDGAKSKIRVGGDDIAIFIPRFISATDNYLCFYDWGERLAVLKINYHAEETVGIGEVMSAK